MKKLTTMIAVGLVSVAGLASALHVSTASTVNFLNAPEKHITIPVKKDKASQSAFVVDAAQLKSKNNSKAGLVALTCRCHIWRYEESQRRWILNFI